MRKKWGSSWNSSTPGLNLAKSHTPKAGFLQWSPKELELWLFQINIMSKFQTYKQQKKEVPSITKSNSKTDSSKSPVKAHIKPSTTTAQKPGTVSNGVVEKTPSLFVGTKQTIAVNAKQQQTSKPVGKCKKLGRPPDMRNGK